MHLEFWLQKVISYIFETEMNLIFVSFICPQGLNIDQTPTVTFVQRQSASPLVRARLLGHKRLRLELDMPMCFLLELKWFLDSCPCFTPVQRPDCSRTWTPVWNHARTSISTPAEAGSSVTSFPRRAHFTASLISSETSWRLYSRVCYVRLTQHKATRHCSEFAWH